MLKPDNSNEPVTGESQERFFDLVPDLSVLAEQHGVKPVTSLEDLRANFWPESESDEEVVTAIREWRRQGG